MHNYLIRHYKPEDKTELIKLFNEFGNYLKLLDEPGLDLLVVPDDYAEKYYEKMLNDVSTKQGQIYVLDVDGVVSGFVAGVIFDVGDEPDEFDCKPHKMGRVIELFVAESYRGQGFGKKLLQKLEQYFKEKGCLKMNLEVFAPNTNAYQFYKKYGFIERNIDLVKLLDPQ